MQQPKKYLFDHPKNVKRVLYILYGCCALLLVLDFVIPRHISHSWENLWGFYPLYGFVGCVLLVLVATGMRRFVKREQNYYEQTSTQHGDEFKQKTTSLESQLTNKTVDPHVDD